MRRLAPPAAALAAVALAAALISCPTGQADRSDIVLSYTYIEGDTTPEIIEALELERQLGGTRVRPLNIPRAALFREPYVLSLSTGSPDIDLYLLDAPWVKSYSATRWLAPIAAGDGEIDLSPFRSELLEVISTGEGPDRRVLAVPFETKGNILFYRADLLEEAGFRPPATWDELFAQCLSILAERGGGGEGGVRWGILFHGMAFINDFYPIAWGFGGGIFDAEGNLAIDRPQNVRALALVKRMLGRISPDPLEMEEAGLFDDYLAVERLFARGQAIFMVNWNTRWGDLERGLPGQEISIGQVGVAPIPAGEGGRSHSNIGSFCWGINYSSRHREEARRFIELVTSYEAQRWRALHHGDLPSRWDVLEDPEVAARAPSVLRMARVFEQVQLRARPYQREINDYLDYVIVEALINDLDPLEVLSNAQKEIAEELAWLRGRDDPAGR